MRTTSDRPTPLDSFRLAAALLVVAVHTGPLQSVSPTMDFWLCRVLARLAVPFFMMLTGYFCLKPGRIAKTAGRLLALYAGASLLYLPAALYAGYYPTAGAAVHRVLLGQTFYHLWYLPAAAVGLLLAAAFLRALGLWGAGAVCAALYAFGLLGGSWYGLACCFLPLRQLLDTLLAVMDTTRNGLFYAPLFLWLGYVLAQGKFALPRRAASLTLAASLAAMSAEAFALRQTGLMQQDAAWLFLPLASAALFRLLALQPGTPCRTLRKVSMWVYLLHPLAILAVRAAARLLHLTGLLVDNSPVHFAAVCFVSLLAAQLLTLLPCPRPDSRGRAWVEIDTDALRHNAALLQSRLPRGCELMPAVKADAYGHGGVQTAMALQKDGVKHFCVACAAEGYALRKGGIRGEILILGYTDPADFALLRRMHLTQTVCSREYAARLAAFGGLHVHIAVDTGMHRLGLPCTDADGIAALLADRRLKADGIFTHLCTDDTLDPADEAFAARQIEAFTALCSTLRARGLTLPPTHLQSSYGILRHPDVHCALARPGIALYGVLSTTGQTSAFGAGLQPVAAVKARIAAVHDLPDTGAGYGLACHAKRAAVAAIGYADGIPRSLGGKGVALLHGQQVPIAGRICMDQLYLDISALPAGSVHPGDVVTLLGRDGSQCLTACDMAEAAGTISNEILSRLGTRLNRICL